MRPPPPVSPLFPYTTLFRSPVDLAAGENLALAGTSFAFNEPAGNAAAGIGVFTVVDGQGEEIDSLPRFRVGDRKSTRLNSSHRCISYAVFCLKKKKILKTES